MPRPVLAAVLGAALLVTGLAAPGARAGLDVWTSAGPPGAGHGSIARHGNLLLVGRLSGVGGGIWRSGDGGRSWERSQGDRGWGIHGLAIDPHVPTRAFAATQSGLLRSIDGGRTWEEISGGLGSGRWFREVVLDPVHAGRGYVTAAAGGGALAVHRFDDGGLGTWATIPGSPPDAYGLAADSGGALWVLGTGGPHRWVAGATAWRPVVDGLAPGVSPAGLAVDPTGAGTVWLATSRGPYRVPSGGSTWTPATTDGLPANGVLQRVLVDGAGTVYVEDALRSLFVLTPGATAWVRADTGLRDPPSVIAVDSGPSDGLVATVPGLRPVWQTTDRGNTWTALPPTLTSGGVEAMAASPHVAGVLLALTHEGLGAIVRTADGGRSWSAVVGPPEVIAVEADARLGRWYAAATGGRLHRSDDDGRTFDVLPGGAPVSALALAADPATPGLVWARGRVSRDAGATWTDLPAILPPPALAPAVHDYVADRAQPGAVFAATERGVYRLAPGARTWTPRSSGIGAMRVSALAQEPDRPARMVALVSGAGPYRSENGGATWVPAASGLRDASPRAVIADPELPGVWYLGGGNGLYRSTDGARTWHAFGLDEPIAALAADASGRTLYAGRWAGGLAVRTRGVAPRALTGPTATGTARLGATLQGTAGRWDGTPPPRLALRWLRCDRAGARCAAIPGATAAAYRVGLADVGHRLRLRVTATNARGATHADTGPTARVVSPPVLRRRPAWRGRARIGVRLRATRGLWVAFPGARLRVRWERCDVRGRRCRLVPRVTGTVYRLRPADRGRRVRVRVEAANRHGRAVARSRLTPVVRRR